MLFEQENNLYKTGWIDLVFANRNQQYGAYVLRKEYPQRLAIALSVSILTLTATLLGSFWYHRAHTPEHTPGKVIQLDRPERIFVIDLPAKPAGQAPAQRSVQHPPARVLSAIPVPADVTTIKPDHFPVAVTASATDPGPASPVGGLTGSDQGHGVGDAGIAAGPAIRPDENVILEAVEKIPQFPGGQEAFARFIRKNLHYPAQASDAGISGRVFISFIVERDGSLSGIKLLRGIGFGCDEEAMRVLRKAPAWVPGEQNGKKVRVAFTIPLVFNIEN